MSLTYADKPTGGEGDGRVKGERMSREIIKIQTLGDAAGLGGKFCTDWRKADLIDAIREGRTAQQENAALIELLTDIGNELFQVEMDGTFYAEQGESSVKYQLATRINEALGI